MGREAEEPEAPPDRDAYRTLSARAGGRFSEADGSPRAKVSQRSPTSQEWVRPSIPAALSHWLAGMALALAR